MKTILVDGDMIVWKIGFCVDNYTARVDDYVAKLQNKLRANRTIVCLSDPSRKYWKHDLSAEYKPFQVERPQGAEEVTAVLLANRDWITRRMDRVEADDLLGIIATAPHFEGERIVVARDKDMRQIPGLLFNPDDGNVIEILPQQADRHFYSDVMCGGKGCPGIPKVGPVNAAKVLDAIKNPACWWDAVVGAFKARGLTEADALLQARMARVARWSEFDPATKTIKPWLPPGPRLDPDPGNVSGYVDGL